MVRELDTFNLVIMSSLSYILSK